MRYLFVAALFFLTSATVANAFDLDKVSDRRGLIESLEKQIDDAVTAGVITEAQHPYFQEDVNYLRENVLENLDPLSHVKLEIMEKLIRCFEAKLKPLVALNDVKGHLRGLIHNQLACGADESGKSAG